VSSARKKAFFTYAWANNQDDDVEFYAQELRKAGLEVKLDRWHLQAGQLIWKQIDEEITDPAKTDAWIVLATAESLASKACREELYTALRRALDRRNDEFPMIGLFDTEVDMDQVPSPLANRLCVSIKDDPETWIERVVAAVERRQLLLPETNLEPFVAKVHRTPHDPMHKYVVELRPRTGVWAPAFAAIPLAEVGRTRGMLPVTVFTGPRTRPGDAPPPTPMALMGLTLGRDPQCQVGEQVFQTRLIQEEVSPSRSLFVYFLELPTVIAFGTTSGDGPRFAVPIAKVRLAE
jgi:hypothetical protein